MDLYEFPIELWAQVVLWNRPPCCFESHPETAFFSQLDFLWSLKENICQSPCQLWLVRCSEKGVMSAEVSTGVRISSLHLFLYTLSNAGQNGNIRCRNFIGWFLTLLFL